MTPYSPFRTHEITINWSNPIPWERLSLYDDDWDGGWYYITRKIYRKDGPHTTPIYIGKASGKISKRIIQHNFKDSKKPFLKEYGAFEVRFGRVVTPDRCWGRFHYNRFLLTVESALITEVMPKCNQSQTKKYTRWYKLIINNTGKHDRLPSTIDNRTHTNIRPQPSWWIGEIE